MLSLVFSRRFAMAHRLLADASDKCATPHGHNETVTVTLRAVSPTPLDGTRNMVEKFETAKSTWHRWIDDQVDHAFQISATDPLLAYFRAHEQARLPRLLITPGDPTTEALTCCMMAKLNAFLAAEGGKLTCTAIAIEETPTNSVTFEGDPLAALGIPASQDVWWCRADMSINDLAP
jgi:6-pyruvoyltetrahydropterin/6-carboxytetrahydropterin synthase